MDANLSMEQIRMDVKNVTALNQEGYDMKRSSRAWKKAGNQRWKWRKKKMRRRKRAAKMRKQ